MQVSVNFFTPGPQLIYAVNEDTGRDLYCLTDLVWVPTAATCKLFYDNGVPGKNKLKLVESEMIATGWYRVFPNPLKRFNLSPGQYTISAQSNFGAGTKNGVAVWFTNTSTGGNTISYLANYSFGSSYLANTFTATQTECDADYICFAFRAAGGSYAIIEAAQVMLEEGPSPTAYEPYTGGIIELPGTNIHMGNTGAGDYHTQTWRTAFKFEDIPFTREGLHAACVEVTDGGKTITSLPFYLAVERSIE